MNSTESPAQKRDLTCEEQVIQAGKFHGQETDAIVQQEVTRNPKLATNGLEVDDNGGKERKE